MQLKDTLEIQRHRVDTIFYLQAIDELHHDDTVLAGYYLDRALEFNRLNTDALIAKAKILFASGEYDEDEEGNGIEARFFNPDGTLFALMKREIEYWEDLDDIM